MKVSSRSSYAIKALTDLALDPRPTGVPMTELAEKYEISDSTMELVFSKLRRLGVVQGRRGRAGGYLLVRDPNDLCIGDVVLEVEDWRRLRPTRDEIQFPTDPGVRVWRTLGGKVGAFLESMTLADLLAEMEQRQSEMDTR